MARSRPEPSSANLLEAAMRYLSRYSASEAGVARILERRIARWRETAEGDHADLAARAAAARAQIPSILARLRDGGILNDMQYASVRVQRLVRSGRSRQVIESHLATRGIPADARQRALADSSADEVVSALLTARRRRLGPFRKSGSERAREKEMAALSRAGFPQDVVRQVMRLSLAEATAILDQGAEAERSEPTLD